MKVTQQKIQQIDQYRYKLPRDYKPGMLTDGIIYSNQQLLEGLFKEKAIEQLANIASLPGVVGNVLAMPDIHWGYGFPIGGVAATNIDKSGVISPGGVGFDINCGVRLVKTDLFYNKIKPFLPKLLENLYHNIPAGIGSKGLLKLGPKEKTKILLKGAKWAVEKGYGTPQDIEHTEENGCLKEADPALVSKNAFERGKQQVGTLGSGNHFIEVQKISKVYDQQIAFAFGLEQEQIVILIHSGSRGLGHQVCTDHLKTILNSSKKYGIKLTDRQLACAPVRSEEGRNYLAAMRCAANYAWANRQMLMHIVRRTLAQTIKVGDFSIKIELLYDVAHNIAKIEQHVVDGQKLNLCVHRKGATRAFGPNNDALPELFRQTGQPVIIPGDMGTCSYLLVGTEKAMLQTFGSTCHGAGRVLSRSKAVKTLNQKNILNDLKRKGIIIFAKDKRIIAEEAPEAYKDIDQVVDIVDKAEISKKICQMKPLGVIKG
jgi:tRNA-splicing ligase RtcB